MISLLPSVVLFLSLVKAEAKTTEELYCEELDALPGMSAVYLPVRKTCFAREDTGTATNSFNGGDSWCRSYPSDNGRGELSARLYILRARGGHKTDWDLVKRNIGNDLIILGLAEVDGVLVECYPCRGTARTNVGDPSSEIEASGLTDADSGNQCRYLRLSDSKLVSNPCGNTGLPAFPACEFFSHGNGNLTEVAADVSWKWKDAVGSARPGFILSSDLGTATTDLGTIHHYATCIAKCLAAKCWGINARRVGGGYQCTGLSDRVTTITPATSDDVAIVFESFQ